jgi:crotonobetainyl-CoA:carnitine CoA-transferase CaiB-like acyl-CoA transferase
MRRDLARADGSSVPTVRSPIVMDGVPALSERASPELGEADAAVREAIARGGSGWDAA